MIRFLQKDNRIVKAFFVVAIGVLSLSMMIYLIPGLMGAGASSSDTYAVIYPHWYSKILSSGITISQTRVNQLAERQLQQSRYPESPMILNYFESRVGQQLVQQEVLGLEAAKLGIKATDDDVRDFLHKGVFGQMLFPGGKFVGPEPYARFIAERYNLPVTEFEAELKESIVQQRLQSLITSGVSVGDQEVRDSYRKQNAKIKFDYAVFSADDVKKSINPSDADLQGFFKKNAARYAQAVPEQRKITYFAFTYNDLPGGIPQIGQSEMQQYFSQHQNEYAAPEQAKSRHILIKVAAGADAKTDAAAKAKAEGLLKQIQAGGNFADLAKKNSDDPGSKDLGGELGFAQRGRMVPEFDKAIFTQKIGDSAIVKTQFGYHIVQVEERQAAHSRSLNEVLPEIQATLLRQKLSQSQESFAHQLASEAIKDGLSKTAAAHHLPVVDSPLVGANGVIPALADSSQLIGKAFESKQGDAPQVAPTGEGYAVFQVTGIAAAHAPAFADWKSHVNDDYIADQTPVLLTQKTQDLARKAKEMGDLAKAAKAVGATFKSSDLVGFSGQVPDFGAVGQIAPQLFDLPLGASSDAINAGRTGVVAKITDKQEPSADEIAKNLPTQRLQMLEDRRNQAFELFMRGVFDDYKKHKRIAIMAKQRTPETGE